MASTLTTPATVGSEAITRLIEANRAKFDCATPSPGASERRTHALEAALAASCADAVELRRRLHNFETSTSWRLTLPLRWVVQAIRPAKLPPPPPPPVQAPAPGPLSYEDWVRDVEPGRLAALAEAGPGRQPGPAPRMAVMLLDNDAGAEACVAPPEHCLIHTVEGEDRAASVSQALAAVTADFVCFLEAGVRLAPQALALAALVLAQHPETDLLFADEDWLDAAGRRIDPFFKPGWSPELQRGRDLVGPFAFFRTELVRTATVAAGAAWLYDLANQVAAVARPERIRHIPAVLCHRLTLPPGHADAMRAAISDQLRRQGVAARITSVPGQPYQHRVAYSLPTPEPLVSIIVPTRDRADLLQACADSILNRTDYRRLEMLIVDNGTEEPDALALLATLAERENVQVMQMPGAFNWSALNNAAAARASGDILLLLNNDIAVLRPDWLAELVAQTLQPGVGAVGAKLLYPDGRVQHAGLTTEESGIPWHLFRYAPGESPGAYDMMRLARDVWGVTGACMAIPRDVFFEIGCLNEALPVAYNDVEFCLRLTAYGYRIVWTPWALVEHRELASRPPDHSTARQAQVREERDHLLRDWGALVLHDPFFNPNLQLVDEHPWLRRAV